MPSIKNAITSLDKNKIETPNPAKAEKESLDQIREILFGDQARKYDHQFFKLKSQFSDEMKQIRREMVEQFADLKKSLGQTNADMTERLSVEKQQRTDSHSVLSNIFEETSKSLLSRIDKGEHDIKTRMESLLSKLRQDVEQQHQVATTSTEEKFAELKNQKTNNDDLAALFDEISARLSGARKETSASNVTEKKS